MAWAAFAVVEVFVGNAIRRGRNIASFVNAATATRPTWARVDGPHSVFNRLAIASFAVDLFVLVTMLRRAEQFR